MEDDSSQMAASLYTLPGEVILHIFSFLRSEDLMFGVRATCQYFYDLSWEPSLWKHVIVTTMKSLEPGRSRSCKETFHKKMLEQEHISSDGSDILQVKTLIKSVEERGDVWPSCSVIGTMDYPNLERLTLLRENLPSLEGLVKYQTLRHLKLRIGFLSHNDNSPNSQGQLVVSLFQNLKGLTNLQTLAVHFICSESMNNRSSISDIQASMKDYFLTGPMAELRQIELESFVNDEIFTAILDNCTKLSGLALICPELKPEAVCAAVSGKCQLLLSTLSIEHCETLNDTCLKALSVAFPNLKSLQLSLTEKITNDGLRLFLEACSHLTDLKLTTFHGHEMLGGKISKNLQSLDLHSIAFSSASAFQELCQYSQNLRELYLVSSNITDTDVIVMSNKSRLLEKVSLDDCSHVGSTGVAYLMKNLPRLQTCICLLSNSHVFQLEQLSPSRKRTRAGGLILENQASPTEGGLSCLQLAPCKELTAVGVSALARLCPNLRQLQICAPSSVNDHIVKAILRDLPNLQSLRLESPDESSRQNQLTGACLRHVQRWGTRLQKLNLITRYGSISFIALFKLMAQSSTLVECEVPRYTEHRPNTTASEVVRRTNELCLQLKCQGKMSAANLSLQAFGCGYSFTLRVLRH